MTTYTAASGAHASRHASGGADAVTLAQSQVTGLAAALAAAAPLASPALTGTPTAPTQAANDNSTKIATTAYVDAGDALRATKAQAIGYALVFGGN